MGLGLFLGPPLGSLIYGHFGFSCVFYFFSVWILLMAVLQFFLIPASFNFDSLEEQQATIDNQSVIGANF